jgi:nifR3 family TIM-barrel protein
MHTFINSPLRLGSLIISNRLIQGPLAGYSCAPFRELFHQFTPPAYCVTEMSSAQDLLSKHSNHSRYLHRSLQEGLLAYQISGRDPQIMAKAAVKVEQLGADIVDINCGCPKPKIRKKGAGSALLEEPELLSRIIKTIRSESALPLTVKIRIQKGESDVFLAKMIEEAGADALIVHGRRWTDDYSIASDLATLALIKKSVGIPVIANGDIKDRQTLQTTYEVTGCDAYMIGRAGCGKPWLYHELLGQGELSINLPHKIKLFMRHVEGLAGLEDEFKAVLQSKSLVRYYFREDVGVEFLEGFYRLGSLRGVEEYLCSHFLV